MSQPKLKLLATPDKTRQQKPLVELTEEQLEAIADGLMKLTILYTSFKEELMSRTKARKVTPEKPCPQKPFIQVEGELTEAQLEAIAAGGFAIN